MSKNIDFADKKELIKLYGDNYQEIINKYPLDYPIQYIIGNVEFLNTNLKVDKNVLIPRFETEELVSKTINYLNKYEFNQINTLDVCTGSGAIIIALAKNYSTNINMGIDISDNALNIASGNANLNNVNVSFKKVDILKDELTRDVKYDLVISNPPYVKKDELTGLETKYEPQIALFANDVDGIEFYEEIIKKSVDIAKTKSIIAFEIGQNQGINVKNIAIKYFPKSKIIIEKDLASKNRFVFIFNNCE